MSIRLAVLPKYIFTLITFMHAFSFPIIFQFISVHIIIFSGELSSLLARKMMHARVDAPLSKY